MRPARETICFSKSTELHDIVIGCLSIAMNLDYQLTLRDRGEKGVASLV